MGADEDKARGTADNVKGKAQEAWGNITGDEEKQAEGKGNQAKGNVKDAVDNVTH